MSRYVGYLFVCILWLFVPMGAWAVSKDKNPILIICSYNPAAHQTSVTISDYMEEYGKLGGQRDIIIENMNCKSFSEAPLWSDMMTQILSKYHFIGSGSMGGLFVTKGFDADKSAGHV